MFQNQLLIRKCRNPAKTYYLFFPLFYCPPPPPPKGQDKEKKKAEFPKFRLSDMLSKEEYMGHPVSLQTAAPSKVFLRNKPDHHGETSL